MDSTTNLLESDMGFFDKIKNFVGGHGVSVFITEIEGNDPSVASLPLSDSVLKGRIEVHFAKDAEILNHGFRLTAIFEDEGTYRSTEIAQEKNEGEIMGSDVSWPYTGTGGQVVKDSFCMIRIDIPAAMRELGLEPEAAFNDPRVRLEFKVWADVKGTPMDASAKLNLQITEGGGVSMYDETVDSDAALDIPVRTQTLPLDDTPYLERFNAMVADLRANPNVVVTKYVVNPPATAEEFAEAEAYGNVPASMREFYTQANGLELEWALKSAGDDRSPHGNIRLMPIEQVFSSWEDQIWFNEDWDDKKFQPLHPIDYFVPEACAALYLDGSDNATVYYHYCGEEMDSMAVDFAGYLELLLKSRGYWYWQKAIVADLTGQEYTIEPREFRLGMGGLFADYDPKFFLRNDYAATDAEFVAKRTRTREKFFSALDEANIIYEAEGSNDVAVKVDASDENLQKLQFAMTPLVGSTDFSGDWGMMQIGDYQISK